MTAFRGLEELIYRVSTLLLYPTLALLMWYSLRVLLYLGEALRDGIMARPRHRRAVARRLRDLGTCDEPDLPAELEHLWGDSTLHPVVRAFTRQLGRELRRGPSATLAARVRHLAGQYETELARDVDRVRVLVRVGPCLGLAATLIPLGPGLAALGRGDLEQLSSQFIVAFSATVVGLMIGGVGYVLSVARAHAADRAAGDIELLGDLALATQAAAGDRAMEAPAFLPGAAEEVS